MPSFSCEDPGLIEEVFDDDSETRSRIGSDDRNAKKSVDASKCVESAGGITRCYHGEERLITL